MSNIRELNNWIIDFDKQITYRYIGGNYDEFERRDFRIRDSKEGLSLVQYKQLPSPVRAWLRVKYPGIGRKVR